MFVCFFLVNIYLSVGMSVREDGKKKKESILMREFGQRFNRGTPKLPFDLF